MGARRSEVQRHHPCALHWSCEKHSFDWNEKPSEVVLSDPGRLTFSLHVK